MLKQQPQSHLQGLADVQGPGPGVRIQQVVKRDINDVNRIIKYPLNLRSRSSNRSSSPLTPNNLVSITEGPLRLLLSSETRVLAGNGGSCPKKRRPSTIE